MPARTTTGRPGWRGRDLSDLDLSNIDFRRADLSGANLFGARLVSSNLAGAKLARANLNGAWLMGAKFTGADLSGSSMLSLVILGGPVKEKPDFAGANLSGVRMIADLPGADLHGANLSRAKLGVDMRNQGMGQMRTDLSGANLAGANLRDADLSRSLMAFADLKGADLRGANLFGVKLSGADLTGASIAGADFTEADLGGDRAQGRPRPRRGEGDRQGEQPRQSRLLSGAARRLSHGRPACPAVDIIVTGDARHFLLSWRLPAVEASLLDSSDLPADELGDFCSGAARSIALVGGCLAEFALSPFDLSGGVALSMMAVGGCFMPFALSGRSFPLGACCVSFVASSFADGDAGCADCVCAIRSLSTAPWLLLSPPYASDTGSANPRVNAVAAARRNWFISSLRYRVIGHSDVDVVTKP